jgi:putative ABC transport system permease protein
MKIWDMIRSANRNLFRNKLRTFLTVTAIFVGSFTLTLTNGLGDGLRNYVESQVKNIEGSNVVFVSKKVDDPRLGPQGDVPREYKESDDETAQVDLNSYTFTLPQIEAVLKDTGEIKSITPRYDLQGEYITLDGQKKYRLQMGTLSDGITQKTEAGRSIDGPGQIVIPLGLARAFDSDIADLVGRTATIAYKSSDSALRTLQLEVVGVATKGMMTNVNSFVDAGTARTIYEDQRRGALNANKFMTATVQLASGDTARVEEFKKKLDEKGFTGETIADQKKRTYDAIGIFKTGMNLFAFIALLAASFGIINTLVIAVLERTKEIGLQKALGMGRGKIFFIFSLESVLLGFWGAMLGTLAGIAAGVAANKFLVTSFLASFEGYNLFVFTAPSILFVFAIVCAIAFAAGVLPAVRASLLNPIESLRYE